MHLIQNQLLQSCRLSKAGFRGVLLLALCVIALLQFLSSQCFGSPNPLWSVAGHNDEINQVAFSPDGTLIASASDDLTVKIWKTGDRTLLTTLTGCKRDVQNVVFTPDGKKVIAYGKDNLVRMWNIESGELLLNITGVGFPLGDSLSPRFSLALTKDGSRFACVIHSETTQGTQVQYTTVAQIRSLPDGNLVQTFVQEGKNTGGARPSGAVALSPDGNILAADVGWGIFLARVSDGSIIRTLAEHTGEVQSLSFSPDGTRLASSAQDGKIILWNLTNSTPIRSIAAHTDSIRSIAWSPDSRFIGSASFDSTLKLWNATNGAMVWKNQDTDYGYRYRTIAVSPDGLTVASGNHSYQVNLYNITNGEQIATFTPFAAPSRIFSFHPMNQLS